MGGLIQSSCSGLQFGVDAVLLLLSDVLHYCLSHHSTWAA